MNYLQRDRKKKDGKILVLKVLAILVALAIVFFFFGSPLTQALRAVERSVVSFLGGYDNPVRPIDESAYVKSLEAENSQLKELFGRLPQADTREFGVVIARPPKTPYDSLIIDIGADHGLMQGDLVYGEMEYLIGTIDSVSNTTSVVKLFSSPDVRLDVLISSSTTPVVAEGRGSGNLYIKVPKNIPIIEGDAIIVPDFNSAVVGAAEKVDDSQGDAYSYIYFKLPVNLNSLRYVQVKKILQ